MAKSRNGQAAPRVGSSVLHGKVRACLSTALIAVPSSRHHGADAGPNIIIWSRVRSSKAWKPACLARRIVSAFLYVLCAAWLTALLLRSPGLDAMRFAVVCGISDLSRLAGRSSERPIAVEVRVPIADSRETVAMDVNGCPIPRSRCSISRCAAVHRPGAGASSVSDSAGLAQMLGASWKHRDRCRPVDAAFLPRAEWLSCALADGRGLGGLAWLALGRSGAFFVAGWHRRPSAPF